MSNNPRNPVQQLPKRVAYRDEYGREMRSDGEESPSTDLSPPRGNATTPAPGQARPAAAGPQPAAGAAGQPAAKQVGPGAPVASAAPRNPVPQHRKRGKFSRRNIALANGRSKNKLFAAVHPLHLATIFFSAVAIAMMATSIATDYWFIATDGTTLSRVGLWKQCIGNTDCTSITFNGFSTSLCVRSGDDQKQVNTIVIACGISACCLSLIAAVVAAISRCVATPATSWVAMISSVLAVAGYAASVGYYTFKKERWEFCNKTFCAFIKDLTGASTGCDSSYGYSVGLAAIAIGGGFLAALFSIFRIVFREWNIVDEEAPPAISTEELAPQNRPRSSSIAQREPYPPQGGDVSDAEAAEPQGIPPPPEGDWVYDPECGMYWSEQEFLFMDPYTQHSYDPNSDMWYDPEAEEWYQGEQMDGSP